MLRMLKKEIQMITLLAAWYMFEYKSGLQKEPSMFINPQHIIRVNFVPVQGDTRWVTVWITDGNNFLVRKEDLQRIVGQWINT